MTCSDFQALFSHPDHNVDQTVAGPFIRLAMSWNEPWITPSERAQQSRL